MQYAEKYRVCRHTYGDAEEQRRYRWKRPLVAPEYVGRKKQTEYRAEYDEEAQHEVERDSIRSYGHHQRYCKVAGAELNPRDYRQHAAPVEPRESWIFRYVGSLFLVVFQLLLAEIAPWKGLELAYAYQESEVPRRHRLRHGNHVLGYEDGYE